MFPCSKAALLPLVVAGLLAGIPSGHTQTPSSPLRQRPDPSDAKVGVPPADYRSAFGQYERRSADTSIPWKSANDEVAKIGGWRAYAKEASRPDSATGNAKEVSRADSADDKATAAPTGMDANDSRKPVLPVPPGSDSNASRKPAAGGHAGHQMK